MTKCRTISVQQEANAQEPQVREKKTWDRHTVLKYAVGERALDEGAANERSHPRSHLQMRPFCLASRPQPGESIKDEDWHGDILRKDRCASQDEAPEIE